jgi:hypothetical protein
MIVYTFKRRRLITGTVVRNPDVTVKILNLMKEL